MVANTVHDVFQPFYQCGKLLGLFCYTFDRPSQGSRSSAVTAASTPTTDDGLRARTSVWNVVLLLLNVCYVLLCMVYVNMGDEITEMQTVRSLVLDQSFRFTFKYGIVFTLVTYAWMFVFRKRVAGIVCELGRVDAELMAIGIRIAHPQHRRYLIIGCIGIALLQIALVFSSSLMVSKLFPVPFWVALMKTSTYVHTLITYSMVMSTYVIALYSMQQRVALLNQHIRQMFVWPGERLQTVQRIGLVYERLTEIVNMCNVGFAIPVMLAVLLCFGYNIICMYSLFMSMSELSDLMGMQVGLNVAWNTYFVLFVVMVVLAGSGLARMGRNTAQAIHWALNTMQFNGEMNGVQQQLLMLSQQVMHKHPVASSGLFHFDWTLIYAMIATSSTYLIIMVQLDSANGIHWTNSTTTY